MKGRFSTLFSVVKTLTVQNLQKSAPRTTLGLVTTLGPEPMILDLQLASHHFFGSNAYLEIKAPDLQDPHFKTLDL